MNKKDSKFTILDAIHKILKDKKQKKTTTKKMSKVMILALGIMVVLSASLIYAVVFQTRTVTNTVTVEGSYDFQLYKEQACTNILSSYSWGSLARGAQIKKTGWALKTGVDPTYIKWSANEPSGLTLTATYTVSNTPFPEGTSILLNNANPVLIEFTLKIESSASAGLKNFDIVFTGSDVA